MTARAREAKNKADEDEFDIYGALRRIKEAVGAASDDDLAAKFGKSPVNLRTWRKQSVIPLWLLTYLARGKSVDLGWIGFGIQPSIDR